MKFALLAFALAWIPGSLPAHADGENVIYLDVWPAFLEPDGTVIKTAYADRTHLNETGYARFADSLKPLIEKFVAP